MHRFARETFVGIDDLTYQINGVIFEVNRIMGAGFLEKVYENALKLPVIKSVS
jgi:hypothetical protein